MPKDKKQIQPSFVDSGIPQRLPHIPSAPSALFKHDSPAISFTGEAVTALSKARTKGIRDTSNHSLDIGKIRIKTDAILGAGEDKLLRYAVSAFTKANAKNAENPELIVRIDSKDFARACGVQIDPPTTATPDEQKKAKKAFSNFLGKVSKNADSLMRDAAYTWDERTQGRITAYNGISFIAGYRIAADAITIEFTMSAAIYLVRSPLTEVPRAYYAIDDRRPNAIAIAATLMQHYGMERNVLRDTERTLKIENILKNTSFPSFEEAKANKWGWERVIKDPFEEALDELYCKGFLKEWKYCLPNKTELTDDQAENITSYENFVSLYLFYELAEFPDHAIRAGNIAKKKEAQKKRRTKTKNKESNNKK